MKNLTLFRIVPLSLALLLLGAAAMAQTNEEKKIQEEEIVRHPAFARDYEYVEIPLGSNYYLSCFKRKDYLPPVLER